MRREGRAFTESFLLHGLLAGTMIVMIGMMASPPPKTIRLDFNMLEQMAAPAPKPEQKVAEEPAPVPAQKPEPVQAKVKPPKPVKRTPAVAAVEPIPAPAPETPATTDTSQEPVSTPPRAADQAVSAVEQYRRANFGAIRDSILANLQYPMLARRKGWSGKVEVAFLIKPDGNISELRIQASSGYSVLDEQALDAIRRSAPFTPPRIAALLVMPVTFQLN
jgi:periplasmic protein TonB